MYSLENPFGILVISAIW